MGRIKKRNITYQYGKGVRKVDTRSAIKGVPNTNIDFYDADTGKFVMRRKIGSDGFAKKDLDKAHSTHNKNDHVHDFIDLRRIDERPTTSREQREINKASKKRRVPR